MEELIGYVPPVTKIITGSVVLTMLLCHFGVVGVEDVFFDLGLILGKKEFWRLFTSFTYYGDINFFNLIRIFLLFQNCKSLEIMIFHGQLPEFLYFILYSAGATLLLAPLLNLYLLSETFSMSIIYLLCKRNQDGNIALLFIPMIRIPSPYLPFLYLMMLGLDKTLFLGMSIAHLYYYFEDVYPHLPTSNGLRVFKAPRFIVWVSRFIS